MHSDGPDCGGWNFIYGTCCASNRQSTGSRQEVGTEVSVCLSVCGLELLSVCVPLNACTEAEALRQHEAVGPASASLHQCPSHHSFFFYVVLFTSLSWPASAALISNTGVPF